MTGFAEVLAAATIGTAQRRFAGAAPDWADVSSPEVTVLDLAAAHTLLRRAHVAPGPDLPHREPPADDPRPVAGDVFGSTVLRTLRERDGALVVAEALGRLAASGHRLPDRLLAPLLSAARTSPELADALPPVLGTLGSWLSAQQDAAAKPAGRDAAPDEEFDEIWETGTLPERVEWLAGLRERDPDAGREALLGVWDTEGAPERGLLLACLATGLGMADEPFLEERGLRDRAGGVREMSRELLAGLPDSRFGQRMAERARATVNLVPPPPDQDAARDGVTGAPAEQLNAIAAALPPKRWFELTGTDAVTLAGVREPDLRPGLTAAALRWHDAPLADALLATGVASGGLIALLPPDERTEQLSRAAGQVDGTALLGVVRELPAPWSDELMSVVTERVRTVSLGKRDIPDALWRLIALRCPVQTAQTWTALYRELGSRGVPAHHKTMANHVATTLTLRNALWVQLL